MAAPGGPFHDRDGFIWMDGALVPHRDAKVHVLTHAMHYASAVFEGQRAYGGHVFKLRDHTNRLINSGKILGFDLPYSADEIDAACQAVLKANGWEAIKNSCRYRSMGVAGLFFA
jgi:branched-chain amino acid aminotransferase